MVAEMVEQLNGGTKYTAIKAVRQKIEKRCAVATDSGRLTAEKSYNMPVNTVFRNCIRDIRYLKQLPLLGSGKPDFVTES